MIFDKRTLAEWAYEKTPDSEETGVLRLSPQAPTRGRVLVSEEIRR